ncbi:MAG: flippase-like domain-containing protein, partial [Erysipelotrichaceae bacterium]|nr:flippase-like domain-containing protein [Erysipelotrichaceae bacterium]
PTPGGAGGQELIFSLFFSSIIKGSDLLAVMLIWRFISFYLGLFLGAFFTSIKSIKGSNK